MSEETGFIRETCLACGQTITPIIEHKRVLIKLNGPDGEFPTAKANPGDLINAGFSKNAGNLVQLSKSYRMPDRQPRAGYENIIYVQMFVREEPI